MSLIDYLDPMDRGGAQGQILDFLGIKEVSGGICLTLSLNWALMCLELESKLPNEVWHQMKANGPVWFKQIARNHQAYGADLAKGAFDSHVDKYLRLASKQAHCTIVGAGEVYKYRDSGGMAARVLTALMDSNVDPQACIIAFSITHGGGHAVGLVKKKDISYLYDPNFGVFKAKSKPADHLPDLLDDFFDRYRIRYGFALPVL